MNIGNQQQQQSQQPPIPPGAQGSSQNSAAALAMGLGGGGEWMASEIGSSGLAVANAVESSLLTLSSSSPASGASRMVFPSNSAASTARPSPGIGLGSGTTFGRTASGGAGSFGFGGSAGALGGFGQSTQNLDLNDFPALSSGPNGQPVQGE